MVQPDLSGRKARLEAAAARFIRNREPADADQAAIGETWDALEALRGDEALMQELRRPWRAPVWRRTQDLRRLAVAGTAAVFAVTAGVYAYFAPRTYETRIGEQRLVQLSDGSHLTLNTDTRVKVRLSENRRKVELSRGEAWFDVATAKAPFTVRSGASEVRVTGTRFNVRLHEDGVRVDVLEGHVRAGAADNPAGAVALRAGQAVKLDPEGLVRWRGEAQGARIDNWRRGRVYFDETPMREAVAEMNRYARVRLVIGASDMGDVPVSGVFRAGASESFAQGLKISHGYSVKKTENVIEISQSHTD